MKKQEIVSVFRKLFLIFILTIIIIYVCTIVIFLTFASAQNKEELNAMQAAVRQTALALEDQLEIVANLEGILASDSRVIELGKNENPDNYERSQLILGIITSMHSFQAMNSIIEEIAVLFPGQEIELSMKNGLTGKKCIPAARGEEDTAYILVYDQGKVQMELWYPLTRCVEPDYMPDYGVRITLAESYLTELLQPLAVERQTGIFTVLASAGQRRQIPEPTTLESEEGLMESWQREWEKAGCPVSFLGNGRGSGKDYLFLSESIPKYGVTLVTYRDGRWMDGSVITALLVMGGVIVLFSVMFLLMLYQTNMIVNKPLQKVVQAFEKVQAGDLGIRISHKYNDEFQYIYSAFNDMVAHIQELIENVREQGQLLQNAELIQLQSQINPHFLYNSFYLIRIMAKNESYEQITQFVTSLAKYYRFLNKEVDQNIPLSREAEHMENYIDIQQMRFGDKITVDRGQIPESAVSFRVPKLILQPVVENAYNYGMADILSDGRIRVSYEVLDSFLYIRIEDNGSGVNEENLQQMREYIGDYQDRAAGHALSNIERRLKLAYGEDSGVLLEKSSLGGLKVTLKLNMSVQL